MSTTKDNHIVENEEFIRTKIELLQAKLGEEDANAIIERHIKLLHDYNASKDAAQALIGKLAVIQGTTVRKLHEKYGLTCDD